MYQCSSDIFYPLLPVILFSVNTFWLLAYTVYNKSFAITKDILEELPHKNCQRQFQRLLFTPFTVTRFAMHRIYADRINSRGMSRVFCDLCSQKTPRGILPVNSNFQRNNTNIYNVKYKRPGKYPGLNIIQLILFN